jgi:hypothetical protein
MHHIVLADRSVAVAPLFVKKARLAEPIENYGQN